MTKAHRKIKGKKSEKQKTKSTTEGKRSGIAHKLAIQREESC